MGSDAGQPSEGPPHEVEVSDFWLGTYEITWDQYEYFSENRDNAISPNAGAEVALDIDAISSATTPYVDMSYGMGRKGYPVVNVTQHAALTFCKWLSAKTGRFYRLPTEAEWEYACRAGSETPYFFGKDSSHLGEYAWYKRNSDKHYHKVGLKKPNAFGLYDMYGNVCEWTMDQYDEETYAKRAASNVSNPWVVPAKLYPRTVRGGSWQDEAEALRSFSRRGSDPSWKRIDPQVPKSRWWFTNAPYVGFRIVRPKNTPPPDTIKTYWLEAIDDL
jgi:formylglycine-generating enzyme required for sulfatase activity